MPDEIKETEPSQEEDADEEAAAQEAGKPEETVPLKELQKVRREAAQYRSKLRKLEQEAEEKAKQAELAKLEETDRLRMVAAEAEAKVEALKRRSDTTAKRSAVVAEASRRRFLNPLLVAKAIDLERIDVDPDGVVDMEQVKLTLDSLAEENPFLLEQVAPPPPPPANVGAGATNPRPPEESVPKPILTKPDEIKKMKDRSKQLMSEGKMSEAIKAYNRAWERERDLRNK